MNPNNHDLRLTGASGDEEQPITKDDLFHVLQNARRRAVLRYLLTNRNQRVFEMRAVAEAVAAWENQTTVQQLVSKDRQAVYISLYQNHLPKLAAHNIIEYNQSRGVIEPTSRIALFEPYLEDDSLMTDGPKYTDASESRRRRFWRSGLWSRGKEYLSALHRS